MKKKYSIKKLFIITLFGLIVLEGCSLSPNPRFKNVNEPARDNTNTSFLPDKTTNVEEEQETFNFNGTEEMHICNTKAVCHRGVAIFEAGEVLAITNSDGDTLDIDDSTCDEESCLVEDTGGKEWDLIWIRE